MKNELSIFLDLSTDYMCIVIFTKIKLIDLIISNNYQLHSEKFIPELTKILTKNNITINLIKNVYFTNGPGKKTGIQILIVSLKILSVLNKNISFYCTSSLELQRRFDVNLKSTINLSKYNYLTLEKRHISYNDYFDTEINNYHKIEGVLRDIIDLKDNFIRIKDINKIYEFNYEK